MRIANNIMAMNTHRAYTQNNDRVQTSAEKLSSGYRINRAGDDAAGLAISEKMRSQIRGLNMSIKNSQDAVSLIQTAEGALQEVHSMLQRMNELAVQSATGTNEGFDRTQIAKEFEQLKREINDISEQTTFNNMNILDGSLSAKGLQRTEYTSGVYKTFEAKDPTSAPGGINDVSNGVGTQYKLGIKAEFSVDIKDVVVKAGAGDTLKLSIGDTEISLDTVQSNQSVADVIVSKVGASKDIKIGGETVTFTAAKSEDGKSVVFTATNMDKNIDVKDIGNLKVNISGALTAGADATVGVKDGKVTGVVGGKAEIKATSAVTTFNFDYEQTKSGDVLKIGGQTFVFYDSQEDDLTEAQRKQFKDSNFMLDLQEINTASALAKAIGTSQLINGVRFNTGAQDDGAVTEELSISASVDGDKITIKYAGEGAQKTDNNNEGTNKGGIYGAASTKYVAVSSAHINTLPDGVNKFEAKFAGMPEYTGAGKITRGAFTFGVTDKGSDVNWAVRNSVSFNLSEMLVKTGATINAGEAIVSVHRPIYGFLGLFVAAEDISAGTIGNDIAKKLKFVGQDGSTPITQMDGKPITLDCDANGNVWVSADAPDFDFLKNGTFHYQQIGSDKVENRVYPGAYWWSHGYYTAGHPTVPTVDTSASFTVNMSKANIGDKFSVGGKTFRFVDSVAATDGTEKMGDGAIKVGLKVGEGVAATNLTTADLVGIIDGALNAAGAEYTVTNSVTATGDSGGNTIKVTTTTQGLAGNAVFADKGFRSDPIRYNTAVTLDMVRANNPVGKGATTFEIDTLKLKQGDKLFYTTSKGGINTTIVHEYKKGQTVADIAATFGIDKTQVDGNSWKIEGKLDQSNKLKFEAAQDYKAGTYDTMKIQVGALEGEQLTIKIGAMNTAGLGLDNQKIYTQADAGKAVTATRDAINQVSDQRALLGAMQNRMTHKIANLKVSVENLQASESRIRDIDIASEMTTFTKNNILSQAATSMLAQANSAPQNVLSLLR